MNQPWQAWQRWSSLGLVCLLLTVTIQLQSSIMGQTQSEMLGAESLGAEILWDTWGVPHLYSTTQPGLFHAFGYAQMQSHGNLLLRLYAQARGQAAEYWGADFLSSDQYVHQMGIPGRARVWYEQQSPPMRNQIDAFAQGINDYAQAHPEALSDDLKIVLPITGVDILAHVHRVIHFHFLFNPLVQTQLMGQFTNPATGPQPGSNGWAIAPSRSASGNALLLVNPHLPWHDLYLFYEAHLNSPNCHLYGVALIGMPVLAIAFNDNLGWTTTVNPQRGWTAYELTLKAGGYAWEGGIEPFETETIALRVKQADGSLREQLFTVERSRHGPVIHKDEQRAIALRVAGLDRADVVEQFWQMGLARDRPAFETALGRLQMPMFNFLYADRRGEILYVFNALIPQRPSGDWETWTGLVPGDTPATLWETYHPYKDLPRLLNPSTGWLQNSNDPPWSSTWPTTLSATDYPRYFAPPDLGHAPNLFRSQRSLQLLLAQDQWSLADLIAAHADTRLELADRLVPALIALAQADNRPLVQAAAQVLADWDHRANAESRGASLFALWWLSLSSAAQATFWQTPWQAETALETPQGIAHPEQALAVLETVAQNLRDRYSRLDVPWGDMVRMRVGEQDFPAQGAAGVLGSFPVLDALPNDNLEFTVVAGESYTAAIEFSDPIQAQVILPYGNASQPDSPHRGDQLERYLSGKMRSVWRDRAMIEAHLEARTVLPIVDSR
ncbi:MAG: penicillin acylase family protein [Cyanobacteria bacterium P01_G01_bin.54]